MKYYLLVITSFGLWAGLLPVAEAQSATTTVTAAAPAAEAPAMPGNSPLTGSRDSIPMGFIGWSEDAGDHEGPVTVLSFKAPDQKTLDETAEDLNIMSLIFSQHLERALGEEGGGTGDFKLGIPMLLQTGGRRVEASYLEGFGAVFNLKVRFPLVPPAAPDKDPQSSQADSEWDQARRALAGGTQADSRSQIPYEKASRYNPKLVDTLKRRVIELLRNATHLRHVQPDEWVAVAFTGPPNVGAQPSKPGTGSVSAGIGGAGTASLDEQSGALADPSPQPAQPGDPRAARRELIDAAHNFFDAPRLPGRMTVLTIRIKKKDADAFAANKMSEDQFFHAAEIASYLGPVVVSRAADYWRMAQ